MAKNETFFNFTKKCSFECQMCKMIQLSSLLNNSSISNKATFSPNFKSFGQGLGKLGGRKCQEMVKNLITTGTIVFHSGKPSRLFLQSCFATKFNMSNL